MELILILGFIFYIFYTLSFAIKFNKGDSIYTFNQKILHNILIWLIPFIWISLLKSMDKPIPGSHYFKKRGDSGISNENGTVFFESGDDRGGDFGGGDGGGDGGGGD